MRLVSKSLTESVFSSLNVEKKHSFKNLKESSLIWSSTQSADYYNKMSEEDLRKMYEDDYENEINGKPTSEATKEDFLDFYVSDEDRNFEYEDYQEAIYPEIEKQCQDDYLVFYGEAANWHSRGKAAKAIKIDEFESFLFPNYDANTKITVNNGNLEFTESSHDVPTGYTLGLYSFKSSSDIDRAQEALAKYFDEEDFDMYYFTDEVDYRAIEMLIEQGILTPIKNTINDYNGSEDIKESVMINTGSTTITSDETGVTIEDNGNTITSGNGVNITVDNETDVLPAEDDVNIDTTETEETSEDIDNISDTEETSEDIDNISDTEETSEDIIDTPEEIIEENATEEFHGTTELARQVFTSLQKDANGKYLVMTDGVVSYEIEAKDDAEAIEKFNQKYQKLEDCDLKEAEQTMDIFKNPEFDYKITDITVLQPVDSGDIRAIDMNSILVGLDEALTEKYGDANAVVLNSYLTKHGKDYSSAIVDVSANNFKGYVYTFESSFDGRLYDCVIKETATNKRLEHLCVKSSDPIKPFMNAIIEAINVSYKLKEHSKITEDIELVNNRERVEDNNGVNYTDDTRVKEHDKHVEDNIKDKEKKIKKSEEFEIDEEPDQKNTQGEEVAKINFKEGKELTESEETDLDDLEDVIEETPLEEDIVAKEIFHRKPASVEAMRTAERNGLASRESSYITINLKRLSGSKFEEFSNNLFNGEYEWLRDLYNDKKTTTTFRCIEVINNDDDSFSILVDPSGYDYARYAAIKDNNIESEEIDEPEIDDAQIPSEEETEGIA